MILQENININVVNIIGKYFTPFSPMFSTSRLRTNSYRISVTDCHRVGTKVDLKVTKLIRHTKTNVTIRAITDEFVKEISKLPILIGIIDTILNCSRGEKMDIFFFNFLVGCPLFESRQHET